MYWETGLEKVNAHRQGGWGTFVEGYGSRGPGCMRDLVTQENASIHKTVLFQKTQIL